MSGLFESRGALLTAWFVAVALVGGLAALVFLLPTAPLQTQSVTVKLAPVEPADVPPPPPATPQEAPPAAPTSPQPATPAPPPASEGPPAQVPPPEPPLPPPGPAEETTPPTAAPEGAQPAPAEPAPPPPQAEAPLEIPVVPPAPEQLAHWERYRQPFNLADERPRIAVVVTGLGLSEGATEAAVEQLPAAVTLSFSPYARDLERWIDLARARGHEVMLDLPMEPATFPNDDPGPQALLIGLTPQENLNRLDWVLSRGSAYVGVAGSMGSRFTASREAVGPVLREVKERGLLFLDRRTSEESVVPSIAEEMGLPYAVNDRSVDEQQASRVAIDARLAQVERIALADGAAVAMAQPYPVSIERIAEWAGELTARGIAMAPISAVAAGKAP